MFIFFQKMYSQNDKTGILEALENKIFFAAETSWDLYRIVEKLSLWILKLTGSISVSFLKKKSKKYQVLSKSTRGNRNCKRVIYHEGMFKMYVQTCLNQFPLILLSVLQNQINLCNQDRVHFLNMLDTSLEY